MKELQFTFMTRCCFGCFLRLRFLVDVMVNVWFVVLGLGAVCNLCYLWVVITDN